jgi:hypothetical protein
LATRSLADWNEILEQFCRKVLREERRGSAFQILARQPRQPERHVLHPLLPEGKPTVMFAPGGTGKSTLAAAIASSVASGVEVVPGWTPASSPVLILDWEDDAATWADRLQAIAAGVGIEPPGIHYRQMTRPLADELESIAEYVTENAIGLLIVDSVGMATGSTADGEMWHDGALRLYGALRRLQPITTLLLDHVAGADLDSDRPTSKPFGSVYKQNLCRSEFELRAEHGSGNGRTELLLRHGKKNVAKLPPQGIAIVRDGDTIRFERTGVEAPELVKTLTVADRMKRLLRTGPQPTMMIAKDLDTTAGVIRTTIARDDGKTFTRLPDERIALVAHA